jgi:two-component system cell cycle sensor histidine kinase/response regulator CckA
LSAELGPTRLPASAAVRAEQIATLYRQSAPVLLSNVLNAVIVSATQWEAASRSFLTWWVLAMALMTAARIGLRHRYWQRRPGPEQAARWGTLSVLGSLSAGILWGTAAAVLFDPARPSSQILITFVIGGMGAGAAGTISCYPPAFVAYLVPSVAPLALRMFSLGHPLYLGMGMMTLVYFLAIAAVARITNRALTTAFRLRFENEILVERLSTAQLSLEETNQSLEQRVAERSLELERQGQALRDAQRMEAVGRLAGGIAHDFNNLLTIVLANISKLLRDEDQASPGRAALEDVRGAATRGAELVRQLLTFSRRQRAVPRVLDLNRTVAEVQRLLAHLLGERIELAVSTAAGPLLVNADASQLEQVVINLATNARDAMPEGGKVTITTAVAPVGQAHPLLAPGTYALLSVSDTGQGMDAETQRRAFDPFFTTKALGKGTGLGLATVHGIVHQNGGQIAIHSTPGRGTCFEVYLPVVLDGRLEEPPSGTQALRARPATILVAEDEAIVRSVIVMALEGEGHQILAAKDGEGALALLKEHAHPIDLVITDVVMPGMGGPELARHVRAVRPDVRLLFISGYSWEAELPGDLGRDSELLEKPFTIEALLHRVALALARER